MLNVCIEVFMSKMFKLLENQLDMLFSCYNGSHKTAMSAQGIAEYILNHDEKDKYTKDELNLTKKISEKIDEFIFRLEVDGDNIKEIKSKILNLY